MPDLPGGASQPARGAGPAGTGGGALPGAPGRKCDASVSLADMTYVSANVWPGAGICAQLTAAIGRLQL